MKNTSILAKSEASVEKYLLIRSTINQDRYKETSVTIKMASLWPNVVNPNLETSIYLFLIYCWQQMLWSNFESTKFWVNQFRKQWYFKIELFFLIGSYNKFKRGMEWNETYWLGVLVLTRSRTFSHFIWNPVIWFAVQISWLVSIWNVTLGWRCAWSAK